MARCYIGTSGWNYPHWANGVFYPPGLSSTQWLGYYSGFFHTVEINNTFYQLPKKETINRWRSNTPKDFVFAVKASRFITHIKKLKDPEDNLDLFYQAVRGLGKKLGPVLFQLPPNWKANPSRLAVFLSVLKKRREWRSLPVVMEFRDSSWLCDQVIELLEKHRVSLCLADFPGSIVAGPITSSRVYIRRHGPVGPYESKYSRGLLQQEAKRIRVWLSEGKDVYVYFNNDVHGWAVENAGVLQSMIHYKEEIILK